MLQSATPPPTSVLRFAKRALIMREAPSSVAGFLSRRRTYAQNPPVFQPLSCWPFCGILSAQDERGRIRAAGQYQRPPERNVVELVHKLMELRFIDFNLFHTVSGKEYITPDQLMLEMEVEIKKSGRLSLLDLCDIIGVDMYHVDRQAQEIASDDAGIMLLNEEIIS